MKLTHFFIERPRFAIVINAFITLFGLAAMVSLPVAQYPDIRFRRPSRSDDSLSRRFSRHNRTDCRDTAGTSNQRRRKYGLHH